MEKCLEEVEGKWHKVAHGTDDVSVVPLSWYELVVLHHVDRGIVLNSGLLNQDCNVATHLCYQAGSYEQCYINLEDYCVFVYHIRGKGSFLAEAVVE